MAGLPKELRQGLRALAANRNKQTRKKLTGTPIASKQLPEDGTYTTDVLRNHKLLKPPYDPVKMLDIVESSSILPQCVDAMMLNLDGFGYELMYAGPPELVDSDEALKEKQILTDFFDQVNESQSFTTLRKETRQDLESTGNGYWEVIRFEDETIAVMYYLDSRYVRLQLIQEKAVEVTVPLKRYGEARDVKVKKRFRRFAMIVRTESGSQKIKWFKQFGDPRPMNATTGLYEGDEKYTDEDPATEIIHLKIGTDSYGIPRWVGNILNAMGMHAADFVNWDLFENQVVPPLAIMVSGGVLTAESVEDVKQILLQKRGLENFNKIIILEAQGEGGTNERNAVKIELKELSAARKEDAMFVQYVDKGERRVRGAFRLPPLYLGQAETYSKSTADSSRMVAEEQVFVPIRNQFDEMVNLLLMPQLGAKYYKFRSKGPRLITGEDIILGFDTFAKQGIISMNEGVKLANNVLGLDLTVYEQAWGNYPIPIVVELARLGLLSDIDEIIAGASSFADSLDALNFEDEEKAAKAYIILSSIRNTLSKLQHARNEDSDFADDTSAGRIVKVYKCSACGEDMPDKDDPCPHCGAHA